MADQRMNQEMSNVFLLAIIFGAIDIAEQAYWMPYLSFSLSWRSHIEILIVEFLGILEIEAVIVIVGIQILLSYEQFVAYLALIFAIQD